MPTAGNIPYKYNIVLYYISLLLKLLIYINNQSINKSKEIKKVIHFYGQMGKNTLSFSFLVLNKKERNYINPRLK